MFYRRFGKTRLRMPVLSAGFMRAMHSWHDVPEHEIPAASQENLEIVVRRALELGINHFETARGYGTSEIQLGRALQIVPRKSILVQTKVPPADDPREFRKNVEDSISRLGLEQVDLLAIHGINDHRELWRVCRQGGCLQMARKLQQDGLIGHVGFSGHGPVEVILEAVRHENDDGFDYLNVHWYYINQENSLALEEANSRDMGVFIISPTDKGGMLQNPSGKMQTLCRPFTPIQFNDLYCLLHPAIHTISVGASRPEDFDEHVAALDLLGTAKKQVSFIDRRLQETMQEKTGFIRPGGLGAKLPPWDETPGYINMRYVFRLFNLARGWDLLEYGKKQYRKLGIDVKWVPGNNAAGAAEFDLASIAEKAGMNSSELTRLLHEAHDLFGNK